MDKEALAASLKFKEMFDRAIDHNYGLRLYHHTHPMGLEKAVEWLNNLPDTFEDLPERLDDALISEEYLLALYASANYLRHCALYEDKP